MKLSEIKKAGSFPLDEITREQPFPAGTGGSRSFRIPGLLRLSDGSLFAASDARYDAPDDDCGGIDTIWALSSDGGETWRHGWAALFPDTLGTPENLHDATVCIDPMPVQTADGVLHLFVNLGPTGVTTALRVPGTGTGFLAVDGVSRLMLTDDVTKADGDPAGFPYYLGDYAAGFAPICTVAGEETVYAADEAFNLYEKTAAGFAPLLQPQIGTGAPVYQNLFYRDSLFHVFNTMYILHLSSRDAARTWRWELVSDRIKLPGETALIAAPGNGTVMPDGVTVLPFYTMQNGKSNSLLVFSDDHCRSFFRSPCLPAAPEIPWSGECKPVSLPNGDVRLFFRNDSSRICYADYCREAKRWLPPVTLPVLVHSDCNFAALGQGRIIFIAYARGVGPQASCRSHGRVYIFRLDDENRMALFDVLRITDGAFSYAVLASEDEHTLSVLYDTCGDGVVLFQKVKMDL